MSAANNHAIHLICSFRRRKTVISVSGSHGTLWLTVIQRCDGARPVCNKCSRTTRPQDCEYTDNFGYTRAEQLEHYLAQLEARLRELQLPHESRAPVLLHDPHSTMPGTPVARECFLIIIVFEHTRTYISFEGHPSTSSRSSSRLDLLQVQQL